MRCDQFTRRFVWIVGVMTGVAGAAERINLVDFGTVVAFEEADGKLDVKPLERGVDGWMAEPMADEQFSIGVQWDQPREIAEVEIEFRHAIADRQLIQVQYDRNSIPSTQSSTRTAMSSEPSRPIWTTAQTEWWAGDREVGFAFVPLNIERPGKDVPATKTRSTARLRFLLGKRDLPPVRYIRVYGPHRVTQTTFRIQLDAHSSLEPPLEATVTNGYLLEDDDKSTTQSLQSLSEDERITVRFFDKLIDGPNRTVVTLNDDRDVSRVSFLPAEVLRSGLMRLTGAGVVITTQAIPTSLPTTQPEAKP